MGQEFMTFIQRLEYIAFFSGYPLVYAVVMVISGQPGNRQGYLQCLRNSLPLSYALAATLYTAMLIRNLMPDVSFTTLKNYVQLPFLAWWAFSANLFWFPLLRKKAYFSLLHSLVFFSLILVDLYRFAAYPQDMIRTDIKLYTDSLILLSLSAVIIALILYINENRHPRSEKSVEETSN